MPQNLTSGKDDFEARLSLLKIFGIGVSYVTTVSKKFVISVRSAAHQKGWKRTLCKILKVVC